MTDQLLVQNLREKSKQEQRISLEVITLIRKVDERKLFLKLGFSSLFDFVTKDLGYEPSSAMRRIQAARLMREIPQVEEKIKTKELSLSVISQAQTFFRKVSKTTGKKVSRQEKHEVLGLLENKSSREAEVELAKINPVVVKQTEKVRSLTEDLKELKVVFDQETWEKLDELKSRLSHQNADLSYQGLIKLLVEKTHKSVVGKASSTHEQPAKKPCRAPAAVSVVEKQPRNSKRAPIPTKVKRHIWHRDQGQCQYKDSNSNQICGSKYYLEIDHLHRVRHGGGNDPENLRLLCRAHNQWRG